MVRILRKDYRNSQWHRQGGKEIGIGIGTEEMIVAATTEDGDCDGAPDQQQQGGGMVRSSRQNPLGECLWSTR